MTRRCPKCGAEYDAHPATSRENGEAICPACGVRESMAHMGVDREEAERVVGVLKKHGKLTAEEH